MEPNPQPMIPCLPESAPFTPEQRAYLNGFFAGLFSRTPAPQAMPGGAPPQSTPALTPLTILFGSQTGNAEGLAKRTAKEAGKRGFAPTVYDLARYPLAQLATEAQLLLITSTYGDGEPPDSARAFWAALSDTTAPALSHTSFSVCALGDSNYPKFCAFGKDLDQRLEALGAVRTYARAECDADFEEPFSGWLNEALAKLGPPAAAGGSGSSVQISVTEAQPTRAPAAPPGYSRERPFPASLAANIKLNAPGSGKDTRHIEFALKDSGLNYAAGDALGVMPANCRDLISDILAALRCSGEEAVPGRDGATVPLRLALLNHYEITRIPHPFLAAMAERTADPLLKKLAAPTANGDLTAFLRGREIIDLLLAHPAARFTPVEFVSFLKRLQPRLYSISSSAKAHPGYVHITVNVVRYESLARSRKGVCSTFLADRTAPDQEVPVFVQANPNFRPPPTSDAPMIMVGPGTGVAPFRGFLQERRAAGAAGRNWLFFGDQRSASDFMYRAELETMLREGVLTRLDAAFSRDQAQKVYVQDRMREHAAELFNWLEAGAHFYVCGDAARMAKDVDAALRQVIQTAGHRTPDQADEYIDNLKAQKRYQRDVY